MRAGTPPPVPALVHDYFTQQIATQSWPRSRGAYDVTSDELNLTFIIYLDIMSP
jgi:hypothetical protein